jgi:hypothetical protein
VDVSRQRIRAEVEKELTEFENSRINWARPFLAIRRLWAKLKKRVSPTKYKEFFDSEVSRITEERVREEVKRGVQTIQYQVITLMTTNGQAPFITVFMYLNETDDPQTKKDLALVIEEVVKQRMEGVKNEQGVWVTPAFPKLIYVLEEDNISPGTPYYYLTELCAKCSVKRLVPDYISEKKMKEYKLSKGETAGNGDCYPCMGRPTAHVKPEERRQKRCRRNPANGRSYISAVEYAS